MPEQARSISVVEDHWPQLSAGGRELRNRLGLGLAVGPPHDLHDDHSRRSVECRGCTVGVEVRFNARVLTISELARRGGRASSALRFYERKELLWPAKRSGGPGEGGGAGGPGEGGGHGR
jgi:hypothetical protein